MRSQPTQTPTPTPTPRRHRPFGFSTKLATLALMLALLTLAVPLGAAAADQKEDPRGGERRVEPAATPVVVQIVVGGTDETPPANGDGVGATLVLLDEAVPPDPPGCPDGFVPALPPLNPALGCIAGNLASGSAGSAGVVSTLDASVPPGQGCPEGWVPAPPPLNPALGCVNNTVGTGAGTAASGGSARIAYVGSGVAHPGHCAEGSSYRLVLRENADGSLTWLYTCVPDGTGSGSDGPDDVTTGDGGRGGAREDRGLTAEMGVRD